MDEKDLEEYIKYLVKNKDKTFAEMAGNSFRNIISSMLKDKENG